MRRGGSSILQKREAPIFLFLVIAFGFFSFMGAHFATLENIQLILLQVSINGICAVGLTMVVMLGGIDMSSGSVLSLCAILAGNMALKGLPLPVIVPVTMLAGMACGLLNGILITRLNIPDMIATIATMYILRGLSVWISNSKLITNFPPSFAVIGQKTVWGVSLPFLIFVVVAVIFGILLSYFNAGRMIYAVGGNPDAAKMAGIPCKKVRLIVYVINGGLVGLSGVIFASMMAMVQASTAGAALSNQVLAAVLIGGASIFGGSGSIAGSVMGVLLIGTIRNGLILIEANEYWIDAITGAMILLALVLGVLQTKRDRRKEAVRT